MQVGLELAGYWPHYRHHIDNLFPEMMETVRLADQLDFDSFLTGEHHFKDYNVIPSPIALATHVAAVAKRQRLILAVMVLPHHDVQRLAGEITMADHLCGGRLELGFGRGGSSYEPSRFGVPTDYETSRAIFEERLEVMRTLFTETDVTLDLPYTKVRGITIMPPPLQKPYPPIWLAAMRPESAFHMAKQGYHVQTGQLRNPISFVHDMVRAFREGVAASGKPTQGMQRISMLQWVYVAKDDNDLKEKLEFAYQKQRKFAGLLKGSAGIRAGRVYPVDIEGTPDTYAKTMMIGTKSYVQERMLEFKELGFDDFVGMFHVGADHPDVMASMERFGEHVLPMVRKNENAIAVAG